MSAFTVAPEKQPGGIARLCGAMAGCGVNLVLCATTHGKSGVVALIADDEAAAQRVLRDAGIEYRLQPALTVRMPNRPAAGAATFRNLADAGVNEELLLPVRISEELFYAVICVDESPSPSYRRPPQPRDDAAPEPVRTPRQGVCGAGHEAVVRRQAGADRSPTPATLAQPSVTATPRSAHAEGSICIPALPGPWRVAARRSG